MSARVLVCLVFLVCSATPLAAEPPASALLSIDQHRATVIDRIVKQWSDTLTTSQVGIDAGQLRELLNNLRADHLLAASLAGSSEGVRDVIAATLVRSDAPLAKGLVQAKAMGDIADDVAYTPVTPCRLIDTRGFFSPVYAGGAFSPNEIRTYTIQGGNGTCMSQLPAGLNPAALQLQVFAMPTTSGSGDLEVLPQGATFGSTATMVYVASLAFNTVSTSAKVNTASNQISIQVRGGGANVAIDVVGYFKRPSNYGGSQVINPSNATVNGGFQGTASGASSTVAGGENNTASEWLSTVSGGYFNTSSGVASTVPGGQHNQANGSGSFAAGTQAIAVAAGEFVWSDGSGGDFEPSAVGSPGHGWPNAANTFNVRALGGAWFVTGVTAGVPSMGPFVNPGSGVWGATSDRALKENFKAIDPLEVLDKVSAMPIATWNYMTEGAHVRHLGPVSQDFYSAFSLGPNDRSITSIDETGVALAAIQGLNAKLEERVAGQQREIAALRAALEEIRAVLKASAQKF